jgi:hypothetical protein
MEEKEKKKYVEQWVSYIDGLNTLTWCPDEKVAQDIRLLIQDLKDCVPKVADAKIKMTKLKKDVVK